MYEKEMVEKCLTNLVLLYTIILILDYANLA